MNSEKYGKYSAEIGATASCVKRSIIATANCGTKMSDRTEAKEKGRPDMFAGDSWFAGGKACMAAAKLGCEFFGPVKTNTSGYPKVEIENIMKDWPSGSWVVLESKEHRLFAVGYKYSLRSKSKSMFGICMLLLCLLVTNNLCCE